MREATERGGVGENLSRGVYFSAGRLKMEGTDVGAGFSRAPGRRCLGRTTIMLEDVPTIFCRSLPPDIIRVLLGLNPRRILLVFSVVPRLWLAPLELRVSSVCFFDPLPERSGVWGERCREISRRAAGFVERRLSGGVVITDRDRDGEVK